MHIIAVAVVSGSLGVVGGLCLRQSLDDTEAGPVRAVLGGLGLLCVVLAFTVLSPSVPIMPGSY